MIAPIESCSARTPRSQTTSLRRAASATKLFAVSQPVSTPRSPCPLAASLTIFGDRWTLLIVRDMLVGPRRFKDLTGSVAGVPSNVLSVRLARLLEQGMIVRVEAPGGGKHLAYRLTGKGAALHPVITAIIDWAATGLSRKAAVPAVPHRSSHDIP